MSKHHTNEINPSATRKQVRETKDRELTAHELEHVSGGAPKASGGQQQPYLRFDFKMVFG
jgi:hypothetical protein